MKGAGAPVQKRVVQGVEALIALFFERRDTLPDRGQISLDEFHVEILTGDRVFEACPEASALDIQLVLHEGVPKIRRAAQESFVTGKWPFFLRNLLIPITLCEFAEEDFETDRIIRVAHLPDVIRRADGLSEYAFVLTVEFYLRDVSARPGGADQVLDKTNVFGRPASVRQEGSREIAGALLVQVGVLGAAALGVVYRLEVTDIVKQHGDQRSPEVVRIKPGCCFRKVPEVD